MDRELVVRRVATKLAATEAEIEASIARASELLAEVYEAKKELGLAGTVAVEETQALGQAVEALQLAHSKVTGVHHGLAVIARLNGIRVKALGWKPDSFMQAEREKSTAA